MSDLDVYRKEIDDIDEQIMQLLARRQAQVIKIARVKADKGLQAHQPGRHQAVLEQRKNRAVEHGLNPEVVNIIWQAMMAEAVRIQKEAIKNGR